MTQSTKAISRFPAPTMDELPEDLKEMFLGFKEKMGFVPNVLTALAHRPAELRAFLAYNEALMAKESGLSVADKELMIIAFSEKNGCLYCVQSHSAAYRGATGDVYTADQVAINYNEADITPRQKAIIEFALKESATPQSIVDEDLDVLRSHGLSDEDIWDVIGITAFFNMSNRLMTGLSVHPDTEFYMLGRK